MKFIPYLKKHYRTITLTSYLLPILFAVIVSLAHVVTFWEISNPASWAIFLSIAVEVAVLSSIAASKLSNWAWFPFSIVTLIQIIGNVFFSYTNIDITSTLFKDWVELFDPLFNWFGMETNGNLIVHKRILATFSGAMIPLISITFFHFFIRTMRMESTENADGAKTTEEEIQYLKPEPELTTEPTTEPAPEPEMEVTDFLKQVREKTIKKWEDTGLLDGLEGHTKMDTSLFESEPAQVVPEVEDPAQLKLFDIDNPPVAELSAPVVDVPVIEVPPVVDETPAPQDRIIVFEDEKKN
jgi:hypothetical protein